MDVGARALVHSAQFNGKQEGELGSPVALEPALPPQRSSEQSFGLAASHTATEGLEQAFGKADAGCFRQPGYRPTGGSGVKPRAVTSMHCRGRR